jgi:hypothetical protein
MKTLAGRELIGEAGRERVENGETSRERIKGESE